MMSVRAARSVLRPRMGLPVRSFMTGAAVQPRFTLASRAVLPGLNIAKNGTSARNLCTKASAAGSTVTKKRFTFKRVALSLLGIGIGGLVGGAVYTVISMQSHNETHPIGMMDEEDRNALVDGILSLPGVQQEIERKVNGERRRGIVIVMLQVYAPEGVEYTSIQPHLNFVADEEPYPWISKLDTRVRKLQELHKSYDPNKEALVFFCDGGNAYNQGTLMLPVIRPYPVKEGASPLNYQRNPPEDHPLTKQMRHILSEENKAQLVASLKQRFQNKTKPHYAVLEMMPMRLQDSIVPTSRVSIWPVPEDNSTLVGDPPGHDDLLWEDIKAATKPRRRGRGKGMPLVFVERGYAFCKGPMSAMEVIHVDE